MDPCCNLELLYQGSDDCPGLNIALATYILSVDAEEPNLSYNGKTQVGHQVV